MSIFSAFIHDIATSLAPLAGGFAPALAVVLCTVGVRALISPLSYLQARAERRRAAPASRAAALPEDPAALRALLRGVAAGLLPALAQAPFFMIMYRVALAPPPGALFGVPLTAHLFAGLPVFAVLLAITGLLAFWSSRRMPQWRFLPFLTVAVVAWLPLAGSLYLVTSTAWTALEHALWRRTGKNGQGSTVEVDKTC